jgi:hypothetical protein
MTAGASGAIIYGMAYWTCLLCGEPIGAYEPAVAIDGNTARETSRANEPTRPDELYHLACWNAVNEQGLDWPYSHGPSRWLTGVPRRSRSGTPRALTAL